LGEYRWAPSDHRYYGALPRRDLYTQLELILLTRCGGLKTQALDSTGASDHGVSEALYLRDPDDNGVELYWDRPASDWPRTADGSLSMYTQRLDLGKLLSEAPTVPS
jgi:catechol-2,3-dioxygenase